MISQIRIKVATGCLVKYQLCSLKTFPTKTGANIAQKFFFFEKRLTKQGKNTVVRWLFSTLLA